MNLAKTEESATDLTPVTALKSHTLVTSVKSQFALLLAKTAVFAKLLASATALDSSDGTELTVPMVSAKPLVSTEDALLLTSVTVPRLDMLVPCAK